MIRKAPTRKELALIAFEDTQGHHNKPLAVNDALSEYCPYMHGVGCELKHKLIFLTKYQNTIWFTLLDMHKVHVHLHVWQTSNSLTSEGMQLLTEIPTVCVDSNIHSHTGVEHTKRFIHFDIYAWQQQYIWIFKDHTMFHHTNFKTSALNNTVPKIALNAKRSKVPYVH